MVMPPVFKRRLNNDRISTGKVDSRERQPLTKSRRLLFRSLTTLQYSQYIQRIGPAPVVDTGVGEEDQAV